MMDRLKTSLGQHFILGFQGSRLPLWVEEFSQEFGLAGIILFDYDFKNKNFENNILNPLQLKNLIGDIHSLPGHPKVYIDQEGGKVRRLKEDKGFKPLVSHQEYATMNVFQRQEHLKVSFSEMKELGIDVVLGPVIDINYNEQSPDIGVYQRSFSPRIEEVQQCAFEWIDLANRCGLELCLKHFPGLGGAQQNSHEKLTALSGLVTQEQEQLFYDLLPHIPGQNILMSHGYLPEWDSKLPLSVSSVGVKKIRAHHPEACLITDDLQMRGLLDLMSLPEACLQALASGVDLLCIGNNLLREEETMISLARRIMSQSQSFVKFSPS
jgi:beta-N-acetylhexosaminidase